MFADVFLHGFKGGFLAGLRGFQLRGVLGLESVTFILDLSGEADEVGVGQVEGLGAVVKEGFGQVARCAGFGDGGSVEVGDHRRMKSEE
jgi:hypothetical protein